MSDEFQLERFGRHVPNVLKRQLIANLGDQFLTQENLPDEYCGTFHTIPSISHFHGALLFVDISGFTVLSQRLPVDELRTQINSYFKKIIDIIEQYGGDVIKFAGDALFIVWQSVPSNDEAVFLSNMREAGLRALRCGLDINHKCSNYPVPLKKAKSPSPHLSTNGANGAYLSKAVLETKGSPAATQDDIEYTYLNVHAGMSIGSMTGLDIGALDRWEFFIIGQPLHDVAEAESSAEKGQLVISAVAHDILCSAAQVQQHPDDGHSHTSEPDILSKDEVVTPCNCIKNAAGCFRIPDSRVPHFEKVVDPDEEDDLDRELQFYEDVMRYSIEAFSLIKGESIVKLHQLKEKFAQDMNVSSKLLRDNGLEESAIQVAHHAIEDAVREEESLHNFFMRWISDCLKNDFARHVHESDRVQFSFSKTKRTDVLKQYFDDLLNIHRRGSESGSSTEIRNGEVSFHRSRNNTQISAATTSNSSTHSSGSSAVTSSDSRSSSTSSSGSSNFVSKIRTLTQKQSLRDRSRAKHERTLRIDSGLNGELRNVIVLFIAIHGEPDLLQPVPHRMNLPNKVHFIAPKCFNFMSLQDSPEEVDSKILAHYLACIDVIVRSLKEQGGQLRQFIVDDKGTVSIGTFGLRGSTNVDNAAAAIEAGLNIVHGLQSLGLNASVGITAGPAYCGIVGSMRRHEYAVMGPSVNLSARLMGKAKMGEVLCDVSIRKQDRAHHFVQVGEVQAKGFADPIPIFKPSSSRASNFMDMSALNAVADSVSGVANNGFPGPMSPILRLLSDGGGEQTRVQSTKLEVRGAQLYGRDSEIERIYNFMIDSFRIPSETAAAVEVEVDITDLLDTSIGKGKDTTADAGGLRFDHSKECVTVSLDGSSGIGKSAILEYILHVLKGLRKEHHANVSHFFNACSSLDGREPYKGWKSILRHMFARAAHLCKAETTLANKINNIEQPIQAEAEKLRDKWFRGAKRLVKDLPESVQELLPLLSSSHIIPGIPMTPEISAMSGAAKLQKLGDLLQAIIIQYPIVMKDLTVILMDDAHLTDAYSLRLFISLVQHCRGVVFLISWNLDLEKSLPEEQAMIVEDNKKIFDEFEKSEKILVLELLPLPYESLKTMVASVLLQENIIMTNDAIFQRLADITGCNPLYAYELAKAVVEKYMSTAKMNAIHSSAKDDDDANKNKSAKSKEYGEETMLEIIDSFKAHRVEEVIFYRLDRLEAKTQMLLKLASVACASGTSKGFNLEMIAMMLKGNYESFGNDFLDQVVDVFYESEEIKRIMRVLSLLVKKLVDSGEFIKVLHGRNRSSFSSSEKSTAPSALETSIELDALLLQPEAVVNQSDEEKIFEEYKELFFDFKIGLERNMIYELMLEEQKESLHDRVATFLEKQNVVRDGKSILSSNDILEEAFHWERAKIWTNALSCYYRAALILEHLGAFTGSYRYYAAGFRCFSNLQKLMGENILSQFDCQDPIRLVSLMMRVPNQGLETLISFDECDEYVQYRHAIYRVVSGDEQLLVMIIQLITKFAQGAGTLEKNGQLTLTLYHEALQLIFFTWKHRFLQDMYSGNIQKIILASMLAKEQKQDEEDAHDNDNNPGNEVHIHMDHTAADSSHKKKPSSIALSSTRSSASAQQQQEDVQQFGLSDLSLVFPVLAGMASLMRMRLVPDDAQHSKESLFYDAMVCFASTLTDHKEHQLQAMCLLHSLALEHENYVEAQSLMDKILVTYDYDSYSTDLVNVYGNDRVPFTIVVHAQLLILLGQLPTALHLLDQMLLLLPRIAHLHSMGILAISLSTALMVMGRVTDASRAFHIYYTYEQSKSMDTYSFFREINPLLHTWHRMHAHTLLMGAGAAASSSVPSATSDSSALVADNTTLLENTVSAFCPPDMGMNMESGTFVETDEIMHKIIQKKFFYPLDNAAARPMLYNALPSFGICIEYVAAEVMSLLALSRMHYIFDVLNATDTTTTTAIASTAVNDSSSNKSVHHSAKSNEDDAAAAAAKLLEQEKRAKVFEQIPQLLSLAVEYIDIAIDFSSSSNKLKFPYLLAVLAKVKIMLQLDTFRDKAKAYRLYMQQQQQQTLADDSKNNNHNNTDAAADAAAEVDDVDHEKAEQEWVSTVCTLLRGVETKGHRYQMPFMSFTAVVLYNAIFKDYNESNHGPVVVAASTSASAKSNTTTTNTTNTADSAAAADSAVVTTSDGTNSSSSKKQAAAAASHHQAGAVDGMEMTSKVAAAAMQLSGVDMSFVQVLEASLPKFWCGNYSQKKRLLPLSMQPATTTADATTATTTTTD